MAGSPGPTYEFGSYRLDVAERLLVRGSEPIRLTPKAFDTLVYLVGRGGHLVSKDELIEALWPDAHVEENNLAQYISLLRHTLADGQDGSAYIETVPRTGYRFVAPVREGGQAPGTGRGQTSGERESDPSPAAAPVGRRRGLLLISVAAALVILAVLVASRSVPFRPANVVSVAVLPFETDSSDALESGLTLTIASDLIDRFAHAGKARVLPITSVYRYFDVHQPVVARDAGRELHADVVLSGRVLADAEKPAHVTASLTRVSDGRLLWSGAIDVTNGSVADVEHLIATPASAALGWPRESTPPTDAGAAASFEANQALVMGRYLWTTRAPEGLFRSIALLERAVALAPQQARAHAALADAYAFDMASWPKGEREARAAVDLDGSLGQPHATLGFIRQFWQREFTAAKAEFATATRLQPGYATAHEWYALTLASYGDMNGAHAEIQEAHRLDPDSPPILADQCQVGYLDREYDRALAACDEAIRLDGNFFGAHTTRLAIYEQTGRTADALREYASLCSIGHPAPTTCPGLTAAGLLGGNDDRMTLPAFWRAERQVLERLPLDLVSPRRQATVDARLGDRESALAALDRFTGTADLDALFIEQDPVFDPLRGDPRYKAILTKLLTPAGAPAPPRAR